MKKVFALLLSLTVLCSLTACGRSGGDNPTTTPEAVTQKALPEPAANRDPEELDWGWRDSDTDVLPSGTSDMWYPSEKGENTTDFIYFTNGHSITKYTGGEEKRSSWQKDDQLHMKVDPEFSEFDFDIVFMDDFTLYDYVTKTYYTRGDQVEYRKLYEGKKFAPKDDDSRAIEFKTGGDADYYYRGEPEPCKWEVIAQKLIMISHKDYSDNYYIYFNDDGSVKCICEDPWKLDSAYYPQ